MASSWYRINSTILILGFFFFWERVVCVQGLYGQGARRIGVTSLPPMGCLPASVTLFGGGSGGGCVERLNNDSRTFNAKLEAASDSIRKQHSDLKLVVFDIYNPLLDLVTNPTAAGTYT